MFARIRHRSDSLFAGGDPRAVCVARERRTTYNTAPPPAPSQRPVDVEASPAAQAIAALDAAVEQLAAVDWEREDNASVRAAAVALQRRVSQLQAQALRPIEQVDRRQAYQYDGAVSTASWLRNRINTDPGPAAKLVTAAKRLPRLPLLAEAFDAGEVTLAHVVAMTEAAIPQRFAAISLVEQALVAAACAKNPRSLQAALRAVRDAVDPDGSDVDPLPEPAVPDGSDEDPRRYWHHSQTLDGLWQGNYLVGGILGEMIAILFDSFATPDPAEMPATSRRAPQQIRVDAMRAAITALLNAGLSPTIQGAKAHLLVMIDLLTLLGREDAATFATQLRRSGQVSAKTAARIGLDAKITPVFTMGGYRVVAVGRTFRTLPPWVRPLLEMLHRQCRGPDCDRPAAWCEAAHETDYAKGGNTDLNETLPLCKAHHDLVTYGGWTFDFDENTGIVTWTAPDGRTITTNPPR